MDPKHTTVLGHKIVRVSQCTENGFVKMLMLFVDLDDVVKQYLGVEGIR